jgi:hypothetical protein
MEPNRLTRSPNRIDLELRGGKHVWEGRATGAIRPGMLVETVTATTCRASTQKGGIAERLIADIQPLLGMGYVDDWDAAYASGDLLQVINALPGDRLRLRLADGVVTATNDILIPDGAGSFRVATTAPIDGPLYVATAASTALTNTVTRTVFDRNFSIPANFLQVGDVIRVRGLVVASATNGTDTLLLDISVGGTALVASIAVDVANADVGVIDVSFVVRSLGASGSLFGAGQIGIGPVASATMRPVSGSGTRDTTGALAVGVAGTWSVANAGNVCALQMLSIELSRPIVPFARAEEAVDNSANANNYCSARIA